jgi:hypothetical protein
MPERSTPLRCLLFLDLLLITLIFGLAFAHVMELPGKLRLSGPVWLTVQQTLYSSFGPFASVVEPLGIVLAWIILIMLLRHEKPAGRLVLLAALFSSAGLIEWFTVVSPMNSLLNSWTTATLPPDWMTTRNRWELGHVGHAILFGVAFCALAWATLRLPHKSEQ